MMMKLALRMLLVFDLSGCSNPSQSEEELMFGGHIGVSNHLLEGTHISLAMGMVQFMPTNYQKLAVDFDNDGDVDLWHSDADAMFD